MRARGRVAPVRSHRGVLVRQKAMAPAGLPMRSDSHFPRSEAFGMAVSDRWVGAAIPAHIVAGDGRERTLRLSPGPLKALEYEVLLAQTRKFDAWRGRKSDCRK
jgi:hypothetical protein